MFEGPYPLYSFLGALTGASVVVTLVSGLITFLISRFLKDPGFRHLIAVAITVIAMTALYTVNTGRLMEALAVYCSSGLIAWLLFLAISKQLSARQDKHTTDQFE